MNQVNSSQVNSCLSQSRPFVFSKHVKMSFKPLFITVYFSLFQAADLSKPIDKRIYKGTQPTCHDFNPLTATAESVSLLVGFSAGQVQLIDPIKKETSKLFNEEVGSSTYLMFCCLGQVKDTKDNFNHTNI